MKFEYSVRTYQERAITSVIQLFEGQPTTNQKLDITYNTDSLESHKNQLLVTTDKLLSNLQNIQNKNSRENAPIPMESELNRVEYSIEMETGTGKTYVYFKTIVELARTYGWKKFVIVVPSVAIKEGVKSEFDRLHSELESDCKQAIMMTVYDSKNLNNLETYYRSNMIEILLMTMQSFNSDSNILNKPNYDLEVGTPIELLKEVQPIIILDEPQKMGGEATQNKLMNFNPLFILRYSATHKDIINPIYRYTPIDAYQDRFVKKIEVLSVYGSELIDIQSYVEIVKIETNAKGDIYTKIKFHQNTPTGVKTVSKNAKNNFDLYEESNQMVEYRGYKINAINLITKTVKFENDVIVKENEVTQNKDEIMKVQIYETIRSHLDKEKNLNNQGIKVLSLFFIDKVMNYRDSEAEDGKGKIRRWFENAYLDLTSKEEYKEFKTDDIESVMAAYFSQDKKGIKDTKGNTKADEETYDLIMQKKELLLSFNNPTRFIFSHSALREGWDNPNIFQICTLNETQSETKKRQEIGRGLRLPVNQDGKRIRQEDINILTVVANVAYETFAKGLQHEIEEDTGLKMSSSQIEDARTKGKSTLNQASLNHPEFQKLWKLINKKTSYNITLEDYVIIEKVVEKIKYTGFKVEPIRIKIKRTIMESYIDPEKNRKTVSDDVGDIQKPNRIPNVVKRIADNTGLTKKNIVEIIQKASIQSYIFIQPDIFVDKLTSLINEEIPKLLKDGIKYQPNGEEYDLSLFKNEITVYKNNKNLVNDLDISKTLYNVVQLDSETEVKLIEEFNANAIKFKFYLKLPNWFKVKTPAGNYNPDWAIVYEDAEGQDKLYLVRESKNTKETFFSKEKLKTLEQHKIEYGKKHFDSINVNYQVIEKNEDILNGVYPFGKEEDDSERSQFINLKLKPLAIKNFDYSFVVGILEDEIQKYGISEKEYASLLDT